MPGTAGSSRTKVVDPAALRREAPGAYRTGDGRFSVQEASGRWLVVDEEQHDELGLPLVRGPFDTLAEARGAITAARSEPAPASDLGRRLAESGRTGAAGRIATRRQGKDGPSDAATAARERSTPEAPKALPVEIRRYATGDAPRLRAFWDAIGLRSLGDDDESLGRLAERNPGLVLAAWQGETVVGTALGAWDGRRGWIYHVGVATDHRRSGLGTRLVREVERKLRQLGCPKVNVIVRDEHPDAARFWEALGYASPPARQFGREI